MDKVFKNHPNLKVYYKTADGVAFYTENAAQLHAKSLEKKEIKAVFRSAVELHEKAMDNIEQEKLQEKVQADVLSVVQTEDEKEAEGKAKQEAEQVAEKKQTKPKTK